MGPLNSIDSGKPACQCDIYIYICLGFCEDSCCSVAVSNALLEITVHYNKSLNPARANFALTKGGF